MAVRSATVDDISAMHKVRMSVRENQLSDPTRVTEDDYRLFMEERGRGWVYESDNDIVGFGVVDLVDRNIWALFVDPQHEGKGIGSALLNAMVEHAFKEGSGPLWLTTSPGTRAERFYRQSGWREAGIAADGELRFELSALG